MFFIISSFFIFHFFNFFFTRIEESGRWILEDKKVLAHALIGINYIWLPMQSYINSGILSQPTVVLRCRQYMVKQEKRIKQYFLFQIDLHNMISLSLLHHFLPTGKQSWKNIQSDLVNPCVFNPYASQSEHTSW